MYYLPHFLKSSFTQQVTYVCNVKANIFTCLLLKKLHFDPRMVKAILLLECSTANCWPSSYSFEG